MSSEVIKQDSNNKLTYTSDQIALIKSQIAPKATDNELKLFLYQCQRTGLDALSRQMYCVHLGGKMTIQTSIDGFRVIAERSGQYAGQSEPEFIEDEKGIICCKVRVFKFSSNGTRYEASVGVAYWKEYAQNNIMWTKMPHNMISKCAEALALRKAYPQDLSGLYTLDEMQQADNADNAFADVPEPSELMELRKLVYNSTLDDQGREKALIAIDACTDYKTYEKIKYRLEDIQMGLEHVQNPNQKDINNHLKKFTKV